MPRREFSEGSVCHEGVVIRYTLRRSKRRRKTLQITVGSDGVRVAVPYRTPSKHVQALIIKRALWILKQLDKQKERPTPKKFATGETMPYLGRSLRLSVEKRDTETGASALQPLALLGRRTRILGRRCAAGGNPPGLS